MTGAAAAAEVVEQGGAPAPEATPAPAPSAPPAGAPTGGGAEATGSGQPAAPTAPEAPKFPWSDWRKQKAENERLQAELASRNDVASRYEAEKAQWAQEREQLAQKARDYDLIAGKVESDPAFAAELERALAGHPTTQRAATAAAALPPEFVKQFNELKQRTDALYGGWQQSEQQRQQMAQQDALRRTGERLDQSLTGFLKERQYGEQFLPHLRAYVLERVRELGNVDHEEVPYLAGEWYAAMEKHWQDKMQSLSARSAEQQKLPTSPGTVGAAPITGKVDLGADTSKTKALLMEDLKQRLGWGANT